MTLLRKRFDRSPSMMYRSIEREKDTKFNVQRLRNEIYNGIESIDFSIHVKDKEGPSMTDYHYVSAQIVESRTTSKGEEEQG